MKVINKKDWKESFKGQYHPTLLENKREELDQLSQIAFKQEYENWCIQSFEKKRPHYQL